MRRKSILAALAAATLALTLAAPVGALDRDQAHRAAMSYIHDRCGNFWYACKGFTLGVLIGTGVNQAGKPQWFFIGHVYERKQRPWLGPTNRLCSVSGGLSPWGYVINGRKSDCHAITPA